MPSFKLKPEHIKIMTDLNFSFGGAVLNQDGV